MFRILKDSIEYTGHGFCRKWVQRSKPDKNEDVTKTGEYKLCVSPLPSN